MACGLAGYVLANAYLNFYNSRCESQESRNVGTQSACPSIFFASYVAMLNKFFLAITSSLLLALGGCATEPVKPFIVESARQNLLPPPADKAQIVFLEPINAIQGLVPVGLYDVKDDGRALLAITGAQSKAAVLLTPGHHRLMANHSGMIAHFLDANVEAGKRYYVLVRFIYGRGFQLRPLRNSGPSDYTIQNKNFPSWISSTRFVEMTGDGEGYFEKIRAAVSKTEAEGWKAWQEKSEEERKELTLNPQDAVPL